MPLTVYTDMLERLEKDPRPAPKAYAIGLSEVTVRVSESGDHTGAKIQANLSLQTFEDEWTLVPVLPTGTALAIRPFN